MGFDWKLVQHIIERLEVKPNDLVLDPFCGAGTTLVQCKKQGIRSVGVDANPVCVLASHVKTSWSLDPENMHRRLEDILKIADRIQCSGSVSDDVALNYLRESGMIDRGWLSLHKARKVVTLRLAIEEAQMKPQERKFFRLALISAVVDRIADIKFGPEVYCVEPKRTHVLTSFINASEMMIDDLENAKRLRRSSVESSAFLGDSRRSETLETAVPDGADYIITSPPYPAEHDYTRSTRLELVMLGKVRENADLRELKQRMIRCHTKGVYKIDNEASRALRYSSVKKIAQTLDRRARSHSDGFARLYGKMVGEYFGGMISHLRSVMRALKDGGRCAYVVRDQQSLLGLYIDTPRLLTHIATSKSQGFRVVEVVEWKTAKGSTGTRSLSEKILVFEKAKAA
jgi:hypothetical protein